MPFNHILAKIQFLHRFPHLINTMILFSFPSLPLFTGLACRESSHFFFPITESSWNSVLNYSSRMPPGITCMQKKDCFWPQFQCPHACGVQDSPDEIPMRLPVRPDSPQLRGSNTTDHATCPDCCGRNVTVTMPSAADSNSAGTSLAARAAAKPAGTWNVSVYGSPPTT